VDVNSCVLEVHDEPLEGRYCRLRTFKGEDAVAPAAFPDVLLGVGELFAE
jgi:hypothetical protein